MEQRKLLIIVCVLLCLGYGLIALALVGDRHSPAAIVDSCAEPQSSMTQ